MLCSDRVMAEKIDPLALNDGADFGCTELSETLLALPGLRQRVIFSAALLVLGEGLVERAGDDRLVHPRQVDHDIFLLLKLGRSIERVLPHVEHDLLEPLHVVVAERKLFAQRANWRPLEGVSVEERLRALVVELLLIEQVYQRLLDVAVDPVDLDLLGRFDADALDTGPDLVLVGLRALKCCQLFPELRVGLAIVVELVVVARLLDHTGLVALAGYDVCHR